MDKEKPLVTAGLHNQTIKLGLPKGRMEQGVLELMRGAGIQVRVGARTYRPVISLSNFEVKILKPQNIVEMLHFGSRDIGFAGLDWVTELQADVIELFDTRLDPVSVVVAAPRSLLVDGSLPPSISSRHLTIASEYERLTRQWIENKGINATVVRTYGATEVFPPEDADCIVDNTATGSTLAANDLVIVEEVMRSSTRLFANPRALDNPSKRSEIENFVLVLRSVQEARSRVMLELNAPKESLESIISILPAMREPTLSPLHGTAGFAIRAAVPRQMLPHLIPEIKAKGGADIVVTELAQIVP